MSSSDASGRAQGSVVTLIVLFAPPIVATMWGLGLQGANWMLFAAVNIFVQSSMAATAGCAGGGLGLIAGRTLGKGAARNWLVGAVIAEVVWMGWWFSRADSHLHGLALPGLYVAAAWPAWFLLKVSEARPDSDRPVEGA